MFSQWPLRQLQGHSLSTIGIIDVDGEGETEGTFVEIGKIGDALGVTSKMSQHLNPF